MYSGPPFHKQVTDGVPDFIEALPWLLAAAGSDAKELKFICLEMYILYLILLIQCKGNVVVLTCIFVFDLK